MHNNTKAPIPFEATHPGEILQAELEERQMSQRSLAQQIGYSEGFVSRFINGKEGVTEHLAQQLETVVGIPKHFWIGFYQRYLRNVDAIAKRDAVRHHKKNRQNTLWQTEPID